MDNRLKINIIGCCGHSFTAVDAAYKLPEALFTAYCPSYEGEDLIQLEKAFRKNNLSPKCYNNYMEMLECEKPDAVVIDGIFSDHQKMITFALSRKIHTYSDKPLAFDIAGYQKLYDLVKSADNTTLWAMQTARYDPWFYTAKKLLDENAVGNIRMLNCQKSYKIGNRAKFYGSRETYGGTIPWVAIHSIDMIQFLCHEKFTSVYARHEIGDNGGNGSMETTAICLFTLGKDILAHVNADYCRPSNAPTHGDDRIRVVGTDGILEVRSDQVYLTNDHNDGQNPMPIQNPPLIFEDFIHFICGKSQGLITAEDSLLSTYVALLARDSADQGRVVTIDY